MGLRIWTTAMAAILTACALPARPAGPVHSRFYADVDLRIGVHSDVPGIGLYRDHKWSGLDVAVADYVMTRLHVPFSLAHPHLYTADPANLDSILLNGTYDLLIVSYSITDGRTDQGISFSAPYLLSYQGILIRSADAHAISSVGDLRGRKVCTGPTDTTPYQHLRSLNQNSHFGMMLSTEIDSHSCVDDLRQHLVDAVVSDDTILVGYQRMYPGLRLVGKVWPRPEQYGIGFIAKTPADAAVLDAAVHQMISDGSWAKAIVASFCPGATTAAPPCRTAQLFLDRPPQW
jgi:glutamate transport system substrate-binding protein